MKKLYFMLLALLIGSLPNLTASADEVEVANFATQPLTSGAYISAKPTVPTTYEFNTTPVVKLATVKAAYAFNTTTGVFQFNGAMAGQTTYQSVTISLGDDIEFTRVELLSYTSKTGVGLESGEPGEFDASTGIWTSSTPVKSITLRGGSASAQRLTFGGVKITYGEGTVVKKPTLHAYYTNSTSAYTTFNANGSADCNTWTTTVLVKGENLTGDVTLTSSNPKVLSVKPATLTAEQAMEGTDVTLTFTPSATTDAPTISIASEDATDVVINTNAAGADLYNESFASAPFAIGKEGTLSLSLSNAKQFNSYQTDIKLPAGLTIANDGVKTNSASHTVSYNYKAGEGVYTVVVYSANNDNFTDDEGVLSLDLVADDTFNGGDITLSKTVMTFATKKGYYPADVTIESKVLVKIEKVTITSDTENNTVELGKDIKLTATVMPEGADDQVKEIKWESSDTSVATVYNGIVSSVGAGKSTIKVTVVALDGTEVSAEVDVTVVGITNVTVTPNESTLYLGGDSVELTATVGVSPEDAQINTEVTWLTSNDQVAKVEVKDGKAVVTPVGVGTATITATAGSDVNNQKSGYSTITVHAAESMEISTPDDQTTINAGETLQLTSSSKPTNVEVVWTSSDAEVATVDENGVVTGVKAGDVTITATAKDDDTVKATITLTIAGIESVTVTPATAALCVGGATTTLTATVAVYPEGADFSTDVTWESSDEAIATVDENGVVTPKAEGEVTITATSVADAKYKATATITVGVTTGITIELGAGEEGALLIGESVTLKATSEPAGAAPVEWTVEPADAVTVVNNEDGSVTLTADKVGKVTITATATDGSGVTATKTIYVDGVTAIEVKADETTVNLGKTLELTADVTILSDEDDTFEGGMVDASVVWSCEPADAVEFTTVDAYKVTVTPKAKGEVTITATAKDGSEVKGSINITVTNYMQTLAFNAAEVTMNVGGEMILNDAVNYSPETPDDATLVFESDNEEVATIENGVLHAVAAGEATITVSNEASGLEATMKLTVRKSELLGDANGNGVVDIQDVTGEVQYIIGTWPADQEFFFDNADVNDDEFVNVVDVALTVDIVLDDTTNANEMMAFASQQNVSGLNVEEVNFEKSKVMTIALGSVAGISAMQADLTMPEGVRVKNITVAGGLKNHVVSFKRHGEDRVRLAMYSLSLAEVEENSAVLEVELESDNYFEEKFAQISNVFASTVESELINFESVNVKLTNVSGIGAILADARDKNIYNMQGMLVKRNATAEDVKTLEPGIYIIGGQKVVIK